jgi:hypothetical protein
MSLSFTHGFQTLISTKSLVALAVARVITKSLCRSIPTSCCLPWTLVTIRESPLQAEAQAASALQGRTFSSCTERVCEDPKLTGRRSQDAGGPREQMCMAALFKKEMRPSPRCRTTIRLASADQPAFETKSLRQ